MAADRAYDLVLMGATGFTGGLTAEYLATHAPADLRWAVAGRNQQRLGEVARRLAVKGTAGAAVGTLLADSTDPTSLRRLTESARLVATTVGPYLRYGAPLVAAAAATGTDYLDLTGEPEFVDRMWLAHHDTAVSTGARLVHCCGFDSIPHDLGVLWTVQHCPRDVPLTVRGLVRADASFSGGTYASAIGAAGGVRGSRSAAAQRRRREPWSTRRVRSLPARPYRAAPGRWAVPLPTIDPVVVRRSAAAIDRYGPEFTYGHFVEAALPGAAAAVAGLAVVSAAAQVPLTRELLLRLKPSGKGPNAARRARSWFRVRFETTWPDRTGDRGHLVTEVAGGDPGYDETAKMLSEAALCLLLDDVPRCAGQVTTAQAMGLPLVDRLRSAGMAFRIVSGPGTG